MGLVSAVPQILKKCPAKEWVHIQDRWDPLIAKNVDGKSTLRLYLHVLNSVIRIIEEMGGAGLLQKTWIKECYLGSQAFDHDGWAKSSQLIFGDRLQDPGPEQRWIEEKAL